MSALDSLTLTSIPPEDEALRAPVRAYLAQALRQVPAHIRAKSWAGYALDSTGRFLISVGQDSHSLSVHAIDGACGVLGSPKRLPVGKNLNWVEIVDLP